tara:strand:- start:9909 stop:10268 length:360 start_codon:yes stop_codon:yes gene_type:complete
MPHIVLKHSASIDDHLVNYQPLFKAMSESLAAESFCSLDAIKCYVLAPEVVFLPTKDFFIHVDLLLLTRDNTDLVYEKADQLRQLIKEFFPLSYQKDPSAFSFEIRFMNRTNYFKGTSF